jgi:hypothetical protein
MKIHKNDLVKLVLSLTPRERQEFKELHPGNFDYIDLFNYIVKNKALDEKAFAAQLNKQKGSDSEKNINISVIKSYLLDKLLNSLRSSYKSPVILAYQNLTYSDILISKGLYGVAENYLAEIKVNCQENNLIHEELIYFRQLDTILLLNNTMSSQEYTSTRFARYDNLLGSLDIESDILHFGALVESFIFYNIDPSPEVFFDLVKKINAIDLSRDYPFFIKQQIILAKSAFEVFQSTDTDRMNRIKSLYAEGISQWKNNQNLMEYNGYWFLTHAFRYFLGLRIVGATAEQVNDFIELLDLFEEKTKSSTEKNRAIELRYSCQLFLLGNSSGSDNNILILEYKKKFKELADNAGFTRNMQIFVWEQSAYINAHLSLEQYNEVIDCCSNLLYDKAFNIKNFMTFYAPVHFAYLQAHYALGNVKFLTYEIPKSKAILEKTIGFGDFEEEFFKMMKLLMNSNATSNEKMINALKGHKVNFEVLIQEGFFKAHFGIYDVLAWINQLLAQFNLSNHATQREQS